MLDETQMLQINCSQFVNFTFYTNGANINCKLKNSYKVYDEFHQYEEFTKLQINIVTNYKDAIHFHFDDVSNDLSDEYMAKIISSIRTGISYNVLFFGYYNLEKIQLYRSYFKGDADILIILESNDCFLEKSDDYPIEFKENNHWRKVCIYKDSGEKQSMLRYSDDEIIKIQEMDEKSFILIVVLIVVFIFVNLIILFIIVVCRIKKNIE